MIKVAKNTTTVAEYIPITPLHPPTPHPHTHTQRHHSFTHPPTHQQQQKTCMQVCTHMHTLCYAQRGWTRLKHDITLLEES